MELSDRELVERYRKGDLDALDKLIERHRRVVFGFIVNLTGNRTDADDVFQDVWLRAIRKLDGYRDQNFGGWLVRIARNLVIDRVRRRKPETSFDREDAEGHSLSKVLEAPGAGPREMLAAGDLGRRIAKAVTTLPPEQREVFLLRVQGDVPFKEIARMQKVSINTALARMQYALAKLRPLLQGDYDSLAR